MNISAFFNLSIATFRERLQKHLLSLVFSTLLLQSGSLNAGEWSPSEELDARAVEILDAMTTSQAEAGTSKTTSRTVRNGLVTVVTTLRKRAPDGIWLYRRESVTIDQKTEKPVQGSESISIVNRQGSWLLIGKTAIKREFEEKLAKTAIQTGESLRNELKVDRGQRSRFNVGKVNFRGVECHIVRKVYTKETAENLERVARDAIKAADHLLRKDLPRETVEKFKAKSLNIVPFLTEYFIRIEDNALMGEREYSSAGDLISEIYYDDVVLGLPLADDQFEIPDNFKRKTASNLLEYLAIRREAGSNK